MVSEECGRLPISGALDIYAIEKARLRKAGEPIDNFDLLIGATAMQHDLTLVTNNTRHFHRLQGIKLEDWTKLVRRPQGPLRETLRRFKGNKLEDRTK